MYLAEKKNFKNVVNTHFDTSALLNDDLFTEAIKQSQNLK